MKDRTEYFKRYREANIEKNKKYAKNYRQEHRKEIKEYKIKYYNKNKYKIKEYWEKYRNINKEKIDLRNKKYRKNNKQQIKNIMKKYRSKIETQKHEKTYHKERNLKRNYNMTLEQYNEMFEKQNGCCAICGKHQDEFNKPLAVDHNHTSGQIRKLLCGNCNRGLGSFQDNPELLQSAIEYLEHHIIMSKVA